MEFGCGQCLPCRINKQREWVARLQLEMLTAPLSCFLTLTYADEYLPAGGHLQKRDVQLWLKRVREHFSPRKIRYFLVGEYGEVTFRPHYHVILFGVGYAESSQAVSLWIQGLSHVGTAEQGSLSYVCGYVLKKLTKKGNPLLNGRPPEFALMSKKPGIGHASIDNLASAYRTVAGQAALNASGGMPSRTVRIGPKTYPLGRYLKGLLDQKMDISPKQRKEYNTRLQQQKWIERGNQSESEYHKARKARVQQQEGAVGFVRAPWKRSL